MTTMASQITSLTVVYSIVYSGVDQENIKALRHWPLCGKFTGTGEFRAQRASNAENVSIWWRHHEDQWGCHDIAMLNYWTLVRPLVSSGFPSQRASDAEHCSLNKLLNKQSGCRWFEMPWCWCEVTGMSVYSQPSHHRLRLWLSVLTSASMQLNATVNKTRSQIPTQYSWQFRQEISLTVSTK